VISVGSVVALGNLCGACSRWDSIATIMLMEALRSRDVRRLLGVGDFGGVSGSSWELLRDLEPMGFEDFVGGFAF
jgi:hypothetical protein